MGTINWGLIGCGDIAVKRVAPAMRDLPGHVIKAIARRDNSRLAEFAERFGAERTYQSAEELIEDPDVNAVYLATPVNLHLPLVEDFGLAINEKRSPGITGETGRETSRIMEAAYRASREGVTVGIEG